MPLLEKIIIQDFRNIALQELEFSPKLNCISGGNGEGKTNLLEAIAALSTTRLFRTGQKKEGVRLGETEAVITGDFVTENIEIELKMKIFLRLLQFLLRMSTQFESHLRIIYLNRHHVNTR